MSTVLWANYLVDGQVVSDESDKYALYKYSRKLDQIARRLGVSSFLEIQDTTDAEYNVSDKELPAGMESTDELMAVQGVWLEASVVVEMLEALIKEIKEREIRFGIFGNAKDDVLAELAESLAFAKKAAENSAKFNFAVVM